MAMSAALGDLLEIKQPVGKELSNCLCHSLHSSDSVPDVAPFKPLNADDVHGFCYRTQIESNFELRHPIVCLNYKVR